MSKSRPERPGVNLAYTHLQLERTATKEAAFFLPHLAPGMRLLDAGCGLGALTLSLAELLPTGQVVGMDLDPDRVRAAATHAAARGVPNIRFQVADVTALPFADGTFDAVFEHTVFMYLPDPAAAAREVYRVLKPGGVFGARDTDLAAWRYLDANLDPLLEQSIDLVLRWQTSRGTDIRFGRKLRGVLTRAGFAEVVATASCDSNGTPEAVGRWSATMVGLLEQESLVTRAIQLGWTDQATLTRMCARWRIWGESPDSFNVSPMGEALGWKPPGRGTAGSASPCVAP